MAYFPIPSDTQKTYSLTLKDFKGVDFTNSKLNVSPNRASDMKNMIYDGIDHKRPSWNEVLKGTGNVNGCWSFKDTQGNNRTIIHIENKLYKVTKDDDSDGFDETSIKTKYTDITPSGVTINDARSNAIAKDDDLYIFCGTYLVYNSAKDEIRQVADDEDTYIPTTATGITHTNSSIKARASLEEANMLSSKRKNKLLGEALNSTYQQDIKLKALTASTDITGKCIYFNTDIDLTGLTTHDKTNPLLKIIQVLGGNTYTTYVLYDGIKIYEYWSTEGSATWEEEGVTLWNSSGWLLTNSSTFEQTPYGTVNTVLQINNEDLFFIKDTAQIQYDYLLDVKADDEDITIDIDYATEEASQVILSEGVADYATRIKTNTLKLKALKADKVFYEVNENGSLGTTPMGYFLLENAESGTTQISLYKNYPPILEGTSNMVVTFTKANQQNIDDINKCTIFNLFAVGGFYYLFATGNPNKSNFDWHSEYQTNSVGITYSDFTYFPDTYYERLGDSKDKIMGYSLVGDNTLAIHKQANGQRDTLYLRVGSVGDAKDSNGNVITYKGMTMKKVYFSTTQGATGEGMISSFANDNLLNDNLFLSRNGIFGLALTSNIKSNERYALERSGLINGKLTKETSLENACAISFNGKFYLSVNDNCYVADSRFKNYVAQDLPDTFSYEWWFWDNIPARIFFIKDNELYFGTKDGQVCKFDFDTQAFSDKTYIDIANKYEQADITCSDSVFTIYSGYKDTISNLKNGDTVRIYAFIDGVETDLKYLNNGTEYTLDKDCTIINYNKENSTFQLLWYENVNDDGSITQVPYTIDTSVEVSEYHAHFNISDNIQNAFYTYTTDFGDPSMEKVITKVTVVGDIKPNSKINFSIHTRNFNERKVNVEGVNVFSFENINFGNFTFNTDTHQTSYTTRNLNIKCNFAYFSFSSDNSGDCGIHEIIIKYRTTKENKGVK